MTSSIRTKTALASLVFLGAIAAGTAIASAQSSFTQYMTIGSRGAHVSALQSFLVRIGHYPEAIVSGYFGALTQAAVQRFQCAEEIICSGSAATTGFGRVGPMTLTQLNLRAGGVATTDVSAPYIANTVLSASSTNARVNFSTSEAAQSRVYFGTSAFVLVEGFQQIAGATVVADTSLRSAHSVFLTGLTPNTTYHYVVQTIDANGNASFTWPATFKTAQ